MPHRLRRQQMASRAGQCLARSSITTTLYPFRRVMASDVRRMAAGSDAGRPSTIGWRTTRAHRVLRTRNSQFSHLDLRKRQVFENCMRGRIVTSEGELNLGGLAPYMAQIAAASRIIIVACGTSWHAGLVGEYLIEGLARLPVEVE